MTNSLYDQNANAIEVALRDYCSHVGNMAGMFANGIPSDAFITNLAIDSTQAKTELREMFRRADGWNEDLQAVILTGTTTHDPDDTKVYRLASELLDPAPIAQSVTDDMAYLDRAYLVHAKNYFLRDAEKNNVYADALKHFIGNKFRVDKKKSKLFQELAKAVGVYDGKADSEYQKLYAKLADELNGRKLDFKLFLSINPAHILTASNPVGNPKSMLVSCHSLNNPDYAFGAGNIGYARDEITFVAFVVDNPDDAATLNYRKTSRQFFFYKPNSGVLLQSRLYDAQGGTWGEQQLSTLYRDLVQRTISKAEGAVNSWKTCTYEHNQFDIRFKKDSDFGGYEDWIKCHDERIKLSVRKDCLDTAEKYFVIGAPSLCVNCGKEVSRDRWFCDECDGEHTICAECGRLVLTDCGDWAINDDGEKVFVCDECLMDKYSVCEKCGEYHHRYNLTEVASGDMVCDNCLAELYTYCEECGHWVPNDYTTDIGGRIICNDCLNENYCRCEECGEWVYCEDAHWDKPGDTLLCDYCYENHNHEEQTA